MGNTNSASIWTEEGYNLYAEAGLGGLQIERLARILNLNKSSFYHYFRDLEDFATALINLHEKKAHDDLMGLRKIKTMILTIFIC